MLLVAMCIASTLGPASVESRMAFFGSVVCMGVVVVVGAMLTETLFRKLGGYRENRG